MADAKTIDNLGYKAHERFIKDTRFLSPEEAKKLKAPSIAKRAEVLATAAKPLEIDLLFGTKESESSPFAAPEDFVLATDVFSHQLVPTMGITTELKEKLDSLKTVDLNDEEKKQMKTLSKSLSTLETLNKILQDIQKRKDEYHKG
ncbi:MAG: hypothetical protein K1060chlam1_01161 [Candidatus Anoxychlamydiales bacterium]|nr:hypothetical protein [Candidatus Anoxychlamydiales bacterium]